MAGVPGGLLNQVQQHAAEVAVDDVCPRAGLAELHGGSDLPGRLCCLLIASHPLRDRVPVVDEEVLARDRGLMIRPPVREGPPGDDALEPSFLPHRRVLDQAEQGKRAGRRRPARIGVADPPDLSGQRIALPVEETGERIPLVQGGELRRHAGNLIGGITAPAGGSTVPAVSWRAAGSGVACPKSRCSGCEPAVAVEGFAELRLILQNARKAAGSPEAALGELAGAYVGFALEHPALYDAMFTLSTELPFGLPEAPRELHATFAELREAVTPLAVA